MGMAHAKARNVPRAGGVEITGYLRALRRVTRQFGKGAAGCGAKSCGFVKVCCPLPPGAFLSKLRSGDGEAARVRRASGDVVRRLRRGPVEQPACARARKGPRSRGN